MIEIKYRSLVPNSDPDDKKEVYIKALDWALANPENKNIAITGAYGAGKSSIIQTYIKKNNLENHVLPISIATFQDENNTPNDGTDNTLLENMLEQQILQQMFYKVKPDLIHKSRFVSLSELSIWKVLTKISLVLFSILITFIMFKESWINKTYNLIISLEHGIWGSIGLVLLAFIGIFIYSYLLYQVFLLINKIGVSKFGMAGTSIEFNFKDGSTVFNKYIEEIIHLFVKTDYKYVVFEDLDRFKSIEIFERLRGLNTLLNNSPLIKNKKIVFIYALKDDVFIHEDESESVYNRAKFFDFIIPTVKIVHTSNAENILREELKDLINNDTLDNPLSINFINDIALFINDMRTLINICNEFRTFAIALQDSGIIFDNLLAIVVYKNIYPADYTDLLSNKGIVYEIFNSKTHLIDSLQKELREIDIILEDETDMYIQQKSDIGFIFVKRLNLSKKQIQIDDKYLKCSNYGDGLKILEELSKYDSNKIITLYTESYNFLNEITIDELVTNKGTSNNFIDALKRVELLNKQDISDFENKKEQIMSKINFIKVNPIANILKNYKDDFNLDFVNHELLLYLIQGNWLNETYEEYITYFYEGSLSSNDVRFLKSIRLGIPEFPNLELKNIDGIFNRLTFDDVSNSASLNFAFLKYLLETANLNSKNKLAVQNVIAILYEEFETQYIFFDEFIQLNKENTEIVKRFLVYLLDIAHNLFDLLLQRSDIDVNNYLKLFVTVLDVKDLQTLNTSNAFQKSLTSYQLILQNLISSDKLGMILSRLEVKFESLPALSTENIQIVIETESYLITSHNLKALLNNEQLNYELIQNDEQILKYIDENINVFVDNVLLEQSIYKEPEDVLIQLLNRPDLNQHLKKDLLLKLEEALEDITTITEAETLKIVIEHGKAMGNWKNIIYFTGIFDDKEIDYNLSKLFFVNEYIWEEFIEDTKLCIAEIENDAYQAVINQLLEGDNIPKDKMQELLVLLDTQITIKNTNEISMDFYKILIAQKLLSWRTNVYKIIYEEIGSGDNNIIIDYYLNEIDSSEEELSYLIANDKFLWDKRLLKHIRDTDTDLANKYVISIFKSISHEEKIEVIQSGFIPLTEELLSYLQTEDDELFYQYLILWIDNTNWENNDLSEFINSHDFNWDLNVYNKITELDSDSALLYLTTFEDNLPSKLKEISIDQSTFLALLNMDITLESKLEILNHFNALDIEFNSDIINWLLKVNNKEKIYTNLKRDIVENNYLLKLNNNNNIAKVFADCISYYDYDKQTIYKLLENFKEPYGRLIKPGKQVRFIDNENTRTFLETLRNTGFITEPRFSGNKIIIYNKKNFDFS